MEDFQVQSFYLGIDSSRKAGRSRAEIQRYSRRLYRREERASKRSSPAFPQETTYSEPGKGVAGETAN